MYLFYISITCKTLRVSVFNKELLYCKQISTDIKPITEMSFELLTRFEYNHRNFISCCIRDHQ